MTLLQQPIAITRPKDLAPLSIGLKDAARLLGISERHLQKLSLAGEVPSCLIGARRVFRLATLDAWLTERETQLAPEVVR